MNDSRFFPEVAHSWLVNQLLLITIRSIWTDKSILGDYRDGSAIKRTGTFTWLLTRVILIPGHLLYSGFCELQEHMWCTDIYAGETSIRFLNIN